MRRGCTLIPLSLALVLLTAAAPAPAKTYLPANTTDHAPNGCTSHDCTLREAVIAANHHPGRDTIYLTKKTYKLTLIPVGTDGERSGDLNITDPVAIARKGHGLATIDANHVDRAIFQTTATKPEQYTKLSRIAVVNGLTTGFGGGIQLGQGLLGLDHSRVSGNVSGLDGGGINATSGELTLTDSTISGNQSGGTGGGVFEATKTVITGSTISGNLASPSGGFDGGGGLIADARLSMTNSTVAGNQSETDGGGLDLFAPAELNNVTVTGNVSNSDGIGSGPAGGVFSHSNPIVIANSIIDGNSFGQGGSAPDCRGTFVSAGHNLVNPTIGCDGFGASGSHDVLDPLDNPLLGALAGNGGPTQTAAIESGSPAIGGANPQTSAKRDQRGYLRDHHPDIGAYERGAKP